MNTWSERFVSEYERFVNWFPSTEYKLLEKGGSQVSWKDVETTGYEEPSRNKLETFIKFTMKNYLLCKDGEEITDVKLLAKQFRECKKRKTSITKESKNVNKKQKKEEKKEQKEEKKEQKEEKKQKKEQKEEKKFDVIVDEKLDTSDIEYLKTLTFNTLELEKCFGKPIFFPNEKEYQYEWKLMIGSKIFSIYNWLNDNNDFDDFKECEWYLAGMEKNTDEQRYLLNFIELKINQFNEIEKESELDERQEENTSEISKEEIDELRIDENEISLSRNVDDRDEMIDIELDLIDDDVEINIDDIDFDF